MRRATLILGIALAAAALFGLFYGVDSHQSSVTNKPRRGDVETAQGTSAIDTEVSASTVVLSLGSADDYRKPTATEAVSDGDPDKENITLEDENATHEWMRQDVTEVYSLVFEDLALTPQEEETLLSFLIDSHIDGTTMNEYERSNRIAAIIGDTKLQEFLALERNLAAYSDIRQIKFVLEQNGVPLADTQRRELFDIVLGLRAQYETMLRPSDAQPASIESLEYRLAQIGEYERHVMELAPSVLSSQQVVYLHEHYEYMSYQRDHALEFVKKRRVDNPDAPLVYPIWSH
jgi:hypothetical protein